MHSTPPPARDILQQHRLDATLMGCVCYADVEGARAMLKIGADLYQSNCVLLVMAMQKTSVWTVGSMVGFLSDAMFGKDAFQYLPLMRDIGYPFEEIVSHLREKYVNAEQELVAGHTVLPVPASLA